MPIAINGTGTITGISVGGLPDATITPAELTQPLTSGTAVASTSGTSIDFTGIPSWVKRITVMFNGVSTSGSSIYLIQIGPGSFTTSGYDGCWTYYGSGVAGTGTSTAGFPLYWDTASDTRTGSVVLVNLSANLWVVGSSQVVTSRGGNRFFNNTAGSITLGGTLDRIRVTTVNGTDTFDAGSINILYE